MAKKTGKKAAYAPSEPRELKVGMAAGIPPEEKHVYTYEERAYRSDVLIPAYACLSFACVAVYCAATGFFAPIAIGALVVCLYTLANTFLFHAYPRVIELDAKSISFESFGSKKTFALDGLEQCALRSAGNSGRLYLRVAGTGATGEAGLRARYFIDCEDSFDVDGKSAGELKDFLLATEERIDPENIRVRARTQGR